MRSEQTIDAYVSIHAHPHKIKFSLYLFSTLDFTHMIQSSTLPLLMSRGSKLAHIISNAHSKEGLRTWLTICVKFGLFSDLPQNVLLHTLLTIYIIILLCAWRDNVPSIVYLPIIRIYLLHRLPPQAKESFLAHVAAPNDVSSNVILDFCNLCSALLVFLVCTVKWKLNPPSTECVYTIYCFHTFVYTLKWHITLRISITATNVCTTWLTVAFCIVIVLAKSMGYHYLFQWRH